MMLGARLRAMVRVSAVSSSLGRRGPCCVGGRGMLGARLDTVVSVRSGAASGLAGRGWGVLGCLSGGGGIGGRRGLWRSCGNPVGARPAFVCGLEGLGRASRCLSVSAQSTSAERRQIIDHLKQHVDHRGGGRPPKHHLKYVERKALKFMDSFTARQLAAMMNKYGKIRARPGEAMLEAMERRGVAIIDTYSAQGVANTLHAYGKLGVMPGQELLESLERQALATMGDFIPQNIANLIWAYARLMVKPGDELLGAVERRALAEMHHFIPQNIANTILAYATLGVKPGDELLGAVERRAVSEMYRFIPQNIANTIWAYATLGLMPSSELLAAVERRAVAEMHRFIPQNIGNTLWAYATLGVMPGGELLGALERRAVAEMHHFKPQNIANTLWAYATLGLVPGGELVGAVERRAAAEMHCFIPQDISNTLWAYETLGVLPGAELVGAAERRAVAEMHRFDPQNIANTLWAYATLGVVPGADLLGGLLPQVLSFLRGGDFDDQQLAQLHLFLVFLKLETPPDDARIDGVAALEEMLGDAGRAAAAEADITVSDTQRQVVASLKRLGHECEEEATDPVSGYSIDVILKPFKGDSRVVAIEVDGPFHFLKNVRKPNGNTLLKRRLLGKLGYRVVSVPHMEWDFKKEDEQDAYLRGLLSVAAGDA